MSEKKAGKGCRIRSDAHSRFIGRRISYNQATSCYELSTKDGANIIFPSSIYPLGLGSERPIRQPKWAACNTALLWETERIVLSLTSILSKIDGNESAVAFPTIEFTETTFLKDIVSKSAKVVLSKKLVIEVRYPDDRAPKDNNTSDKYKKEFYAQNAKILENISLRPGLYAIWLDRCDGKGWNPIYIGHTKGYLYHPKKNEGRPLDLSKQRFLNHFFKKDQNTGAKLEEVNREISAGKRVGYSFVEVNPFSLRHYIEEEILTQGHYNLEWNGNCNPHVLEQQDNEGVPL